MSPEAGWPYSALFNHRSSGRDAHADVLKACARDALARLILPSLEREIRREMTDVCESHAVHVFARNLRNLLLQSPVPGRRVLALDPGFKSGCKAAVIDECGTPLDHAVLHVVGKQDKRTAAAAKIVELVRNHACTVIATAAGAAGLRGQAEGTAVKDLQGDARRQGAAPYVRRPHAVLREEERRRATRRVVKASRRMASTDAGHPTARGR